MVDPNRVPRRVLLQGAAAVGAVGAVAANDATANEDPANSAPAAVNSLIATENAKVGTLDWQLTYTKVDLATKYRCPWIEGYVSQPSYQAGDKLELFVSTNPAKRFVVDFYRLGYYGGKGGRHVLTLGPFDGETQPTPEDGPGRVKECRWKACASFEVPKSWVSGVYLGKLSLVGDRWQSYVVFIVRDDRKADVVFQCSEHTWQAYNRWPANNSLYDDGKQPWALKPQARVSFDRPYGKYCQIFDVPLSQGSGEFLLWEYPLAYWLEQHGYDVTYVGNNDVHKSADCLLRGKVFLSVGHDEYWSLEQFAHAKRAIDEGVSAAFLCGNSVCFVAGMEPSSDGRPARIFNRNGRYGGTSERELKQDMGPFPGDGPNEAMLMGARTTSPFNGSGDWTCVKPDHWLFDGTGMKQGESVRGLVGWEFHGEPAPIPGLEIVARGPTINSGEEETEYTATIYPGPKNNWVFNAATIFWAQGLGDPPGHTLPYSHYGRPNGPDPRVQKITHNFLRRCGALGNS